MLDLGTLLDVIPAGDGQLDDLRQYLVAVHRPEILLQRPVGGLHQRDHGENASGGELQLVGAVLLGIEDQIAGAESLTPLPAVAAGVGE